jgi:hypothetical protein
MWERKPPGPCRNVPTYCASVAFEVAFPRRFARKEATGMAAWALQEAGHAPIDPPRFCSRHAFCRVWRQGGRAQLHGGRLHRAARNSEPISPKSISPKPISRSHGECFVHGVSHGGLPASLHARDRRRSMRVVVQRGDPAGSRPSRMRLQRRENRSRTGHLRSARLQVAHRFRAASRRLVSS